MRASELLPALRGSLCDTLDGLDEAQWQAETLCEGWDAGDVAAHLVLREREPLAALGMVAPVLRGISARRHAAWRARPPAELIAILRRGPTWPFRRGPVAETQLAEDWIHHQDVRRGGAALPLLTPPDALRPFLWRVLPRFAAVTLGRLGVAGRVGLSDGSRRIVLAVRPPLPLATVVRGEAAVLVEGDVGELLLVASGRMRAADVQVSGDARLREALSRRAGGSRPGSRP